MGLVNARVHQHEPTQFLVFRFFPVPQTNNQETFKTLAEFPHRLRDEQEQRIPGNQLALFGLPLRWFPERLRGGRDERREPSRKRLTNPVLRWLPSNPP